MENRLQLFAALIDLEKACDTVDRKGFWDAQKNGVRGRLIEGIRSFYKGASASVRVNGELSEILMLVWTRDVGVPCHLSCSVITTMVL